MVVQPLKVLPSKRSVKPDSAAESVWPSMEVATRRGANKRVFMKEFVFARWTRAKRNYSHRVLHECDYPFHLLAMDAQMTSGEGMPTERIQGTEPWVCVGSFCFQVRDIGNGAEQIVA